MAYCQECGQQVGADDRFCKNCGSRLSESARETEEHEVSSATELVTKTCAYCGGTGEVNVGEVVSVFETCPVCKGACEVRAPLDYVRCRICEGTGKEDIGEIIQRFAPCERCHGTGWAPPPPVYR